MIEEINAETKEGITNMKRIGQKETIPGIDHLLDQPSMMNQNIWNDILGKEIDTSKTIKDMINTGDRGEIVTIEEIIILPARTSLNARTIKTTLHLTPLHMALTPSMISVAAQTVNKSNLAPKLIGLKIDDCLHTTY